MCGPVLVFPWDAPYESRCRKLMLARRRGKKKVNRNNFVKFILFQIQFVQVLLQLGTNKQQRKTTFTWQQGKKVFTGIYRSRLDYNCIEREPLQTENILTNPIIMIVVGQRKGTLSVYIDWTPLAPWLGTSTTIRREPFG